MSSWANRGIPRKRDLTQIPDAFRPIIIPRAERPEVLLSETVQRNDPRNYPDENEIVYPKESEWKPTYQSRIQPVQQKRTSVELFHNEKTYVFVILRNIKQASDNDLWLSAYHSIRDHYTNKIVIIDDNSSINTVNGKLVNTDIIESEYRGAGELLPYVYFHREKWADTMIFIHDSMVLYRPFTESELNHEVAFHWHFTETNPDTVKRSVALLSSMTTDQDILDFASDPNEWIGCFGGTCIIDSSIAELMETKYGIQKLAQYIRTRKQREIVERIIGIILSYEKNVVSNFGNIIDYPSKFEAKSLRASTSIVSEAQYNTAIIKMWRGR